MYYLVQVGDLIRKYDISKTKAGEVGWTKLQVVARHLKNSEHSANVNELLELASTTKAHDLGALLRGRKGAATKAVQFNLKAKARAELADALVAYGAKAKRRGLTQREAALIRIIRAATGKSQK